MSLIKNKKFRKMATVPELICELHEGEIQASDLIEESRQKIQAYVNHLFRTGVIDRLELTETVYQRPEITDCYLW